MSKEVTAWSSLHRTMIMPPGSHKLTRETLKRIGGFALPHRRRLTQFLFLSVISALLAVATPLLAGKVVNSIVDGDPQNTVFKLAGLIAAIALAEAGIGILTRWLSSNIG